MVLDADSIIDRMKSAAGMKSDSELARCLDITPQAIYKFRKQGKLPADLFVSYAFDAGLSLDWLATGNGTMMAEDVKTVLGKVDNDLLEAVIEVVEELLESVNKPVTAKQKTQLVLALYDLAGEREDRSIDRPTALRLVKLMAA